MQVNFQKSYSFIHVICDDSRFHAESRGNLRLLRRDFSILIIIFAKDTNLVFIATLRSNWKLRLCPLRNEIRGTECIAECGGHNKVHFGCEQSAFCGYWCSQFVFHLCERFNKSCDWLSNQPLTVDRWPLTFDCRRCKRILISTLHIVFVKTTWRCCWNDALTNSLWRCG